MATTLTVRVNESCTYEVHITMGNPPRSVVGGMSLNVDRLKTELKQHGCSEDLIAETIQKVDQHGSAQIGV